MEALQRRRLLTLGWQRRQMNRLLKRRFQSPRALGGTPEYASPEQCEGLGVDIRSNLYSLGVMLWEMVTGKAPFQGSPAEVIYQHQQAPLPVEQLKGVTHP